MANKCLPFPCFYGWDKEEEVPEIPETAPFTLELLGYEPTDVPTEKKLRLKATRRPGFTQITLYLAKPGSEFEANGMEWQGDEEFPSTNVLEFTTKDNFSVGETYLLKVHAPAVAEGQEEFSNIIIVIPE